MQEGNQQKVSKYNAAIAQLYRLDKLWSDTHKYSSSGRLKSWNWILDALWRELAGDTNTKQENEFKNINTKIAKANGNKRKIYLLLMEKQIWIKRLENKQGKGTAYLDPDQDSM